LHPPCVLMASVTVCVPGVVYSVVGDMVVLVAGLPVVMLQLYVAIGSPEGEDEPSTRLVTSPIHGVLEVKPATGSPLTTTGCTTELIQPLDAVITKVALVVPAGKVEVGFCALDEDGFPPGRFQLHPVTVPPVGGAVELSFNWVTLPRHTVVLEKSAIGRALTVTGIVVVSLHPALDVTISDAV